MSGRFWIISILALFATLLVGARVLGENPAQEISTSEISSGLYVGEVHVNAWIADEPEEMRLGLGGRKSMPEDAGMLFVYQDYMQPRFWMKGMHMPLDFLWIRDGIVVEILEHVPPPLEVEQELPMYSPSQPINLVLEVNAGWVERHGVVVGDQIRLLN